MYNLWELRKRKKLSVEQLAFKSGIPVSVLKEYESGARVIPSKDLKKLARALYVDPWDIKERSDPPPAPAPRQARGRPGVRSHPPRKRPGKAPKKLNVIHPISEGQLEHLRSLAKCLEMNEEDLVSEAGKPLEELNQLEARSVLAKLTKRCTEIRHSENARKQGLKRAYLPEGVDRFEIEYLENCVKEGSKLRITLFDETEVEGVLIGFGPYTLAIREDGGDEVTLNKLAIAFYRKSGGT